MTIRVAIADDQALVRAGFVSLLGNADDLAVVGEAADGREAVELVRKVRPDVVLMDVRMPRMDGLEATRAIVGDPELATVRVVVLTTYELDQYVYEALRAGASGFLTKDLEPDELRDAVRTVAAGHALLTPSVTRRVVDAFATAVPAPKAPERLDQLTEREREVLALIAEGALQQRPGQAVAAQPADRQDPREPDPRQARCPRPGATCGHRLRDRAGTAQGVAARHRSGDEAPAPVPRHR
jgi:DNA-binding NarL/FixJ family response regulator